MGQKAMTIRLAQRKDRDRVVELGKLMHEESIYGKFPYSYEDAHKYAEEHGVNPNKLFLVSEVAGEVVGFFFARMAKHYFGPTKIAIEDGFFIHPDHRGGREVIRMFREYERWGRFMGASVLNFSQTALGPDERWVRLGGKLGFQRTGTHFQKEL